MPDRGPTDDALGALVDRRAELLDGSGADADRALAEVTEVLRRRRGERPPAVRRVHADDPGGLPERLAAREPVHPVTDAADLADRLDEDRRLFVLEHPLLVARPMNVVWVALSRGVPARMDQVLDPGAPMLDPRAADTAVFYSIWNAERGLAGLGRGRDLIEGAVGLLRAELPGLSTFVTLSPMPGFRAWLADRGARSTGPGDPHLVRDGAAYLTSLDDAGRPIDPVARFHLGNGARLWRVNPGADRSDRGRDRSLGVMANYRYEPEDRAANRAELASGRVAVSDAVAALLR
jgi:malonyl-CoA decarboxylase